MDAEPLPAEVRSRRRPPSAAVILLLIALLLASLLAGAAFGSVRIPLSTVLGFLARSAGFPVAASWPPTDATILSELRFPRVIAGALVGAALAVAGALFQGLLRNPLADPYVVGTSGGASLGAVVGMMLSEHILFLGFGPVPILAFAGALLSMLLVTQIARVGGRLPVVTVLLAGFAVSTLQGYAGSLLLMVDDRLQMLAPRLYARLLGGISVTGWSQVALIAPLILVTAVLSFGLARSLDAMSLGEESALRLGVPVERDKRLILLAGSLLTAAAVSISGLIGFVGLVVPHAVRLLCGPGHRLLLPAAALGGAAFLVLADLLARSLLPPTDLPVGILTAFTGGPFFLWLLRRSRKEYQW